MEVKISHHPSEEKMAQRIGALLTQNGIATKVVKNGQGVKIAISKKEDAPHLGSSFVHIEGTPGY